jgi:hypothetical protein
MEQYVVDGNKRIAQFMGYTYYPHNYKPKENKQRPFVPGWKRWEWASESSKMNLDPNAYLSRSHNGLLYYHKWDALMKVIAKIYRLRAKYVVDFSPEQLAKEAELSMNKLQIYAPITVVWDAVLQFLDWYYVAYEERWEKLPDFSENKPLVSLLNDGITIGLDNGTETT